MFRPPPQSMRDAAGVLYNVSGSLACYELDVQGPAAGNSGPWDWQFCTQFMAQEQPYFPVGGWGRYSSRASAVPWRRYRLVLHAVPVRAGPGVGGGGGGAGVGVGGER